MSKCKRIIQNISRKLVITPVIICKSKEPELDYNKMVCRLTQTTLSKMETNVRPDTKEVDGRINSVRSRYSENFGIET